MLIIMKKRHTKADLERVVKYVKKLGFEPHVIPGEHSVAVGITGNRTALRPDDFQSMRGVDETIRVSKPYKLASREFRRKDTHITVGNVVIGSGNFTVIAGPCAVESEEQTIRIAGEVKKRGAHILRGGAYKPRTSPYSFKGLGLDGLRILKGAGRETGMPIITEAMDLESLEMVNEFADIIQIGARNMQNFTLLQAAGRLEKPIMLKRGVSSTIEEWMMAAEYILSNGNTRLMLCERGIRSFDPHMKNLLDLGAVPVVKELSHLPMVVDPSHATGKKDKVAPMARGALAVGADAVMIEVHDRPHEALCDGPQAMLPREFEDLVKTLRTMAGAMNLTMK